MITLDKHSFHYEMIGEFHANGDWIHPKRVITSYELILVLEDVVHIREENTDYILKKDDVLILSPGIEHAGVHESNAAFFWLHFSTDLLVPSAHLTGQDVSFLKQLLKQLLHITNSPGYPSTAADALTYLIFTEYVRLTTHVSQHASPIISQITEYIRNHSTSNPSVSEIAAKFEYSPDYIGKFFRKMTGVGLKEYINEQRIKRIKDHLLTTNKSIKQIAMDTGFPDENLFIKFFTYHEGISPSTFRAISHNTHINHK